MNRKMLTAVLGMLLVTLCILSGCQQTPAPSATATPEVSDQAEPTAEPAA